MRDTSCASDLFSFHSVRMVFRYLEVLLEEVGDGLVSVLVVGQSGLVLELSDK